MSDPILITSSLFRDYGTSPTTATDLASLIVSTETAAASATTAATAAASSAASAATAATAAISASSSAVTAVNAAVTTGTATINSAASAATSTIATSAATATTAASNASASATNAATSATTATTKATAAAGSATAAASSASTAAGSATTATTGATNASTSATASAASATAAGASATAAGVSATNATAGFVSAQGFRNFVVNGAMDIWQRGTSFTIAAGAITYTADMALVLHDGSGGTTTVTQVSVTDANVLAAGLNNALRYTSNGSPSLGTVRQLLWRIEGPRTLAGKTVRMTFWARTDLSRTIATPGMAVAPGTGGSPAGGGTLVGSAISTTLTFQKFSQTFTLPAASTVTPGTNGDGFIDVRFNFTLNQIFYFEITGLQLEIDTGAATSFERRPPGVEYGLCRRYYQLGAAILQGYATTGAAVGYSVPTVIPMRTTPTITVSANTSSNVTSPTAVAFSDVTIYTSGICTATGTFLLNLTYSASAVI